MNFKKSQYYNEKFLGKNLYENIKDKDEIFTIQEYFDISDAQKEYHIKNEYKDYKLKIYNKYYELDCQKRDVNLFLVFDKPVHITGEYCTKIIAQEVVVMGNTNMTASGCIINQIKIKKGDENFYVIYRSKVNNVYFYESTVIFRHSEIENFFILNNKLTFDDNSSFLGYHKIKCFGECEDLKEKLLSKKDFQEGIIHIE